METLVKISKEEWDSIDVDYKGEWQDYYGDHPEWLGKKVVMSTCVTHNPNELCKLLIEGVHFVIVESIVNQLANQKHGFCL